MTKEEFIIWNNMFAVVGSIVA